MVDRVVEETLEEVPEIPELLTGIFEYTLEEAKSKMEQAGEFCPFSALVVKDNLFFETHPGDTPDECFSSAQAVVCGARGADAYAFCYDGYVELDDGSHDVIIAEGGLPGVNEGFAVGYLYTKDENGAVSFEEEPAYLGPAPNFMKDLKKADEYADSEIEERYLSDEFDDEEFEEDFDEE